MSPPIGQALSFGAGQRDIRALFVFNAKLRARVVAEIEFYQVAVQVLLAEFEIADADTERTISLEELELMAERG